MLRGGLNQAASFTETIICSNALLLVPFFADFRAPFPLVNLVHGAMEGSRVHVFDVPFDLPYMSNNLNSLKGII